VGLEGDFGFVGELVLAADLAAGLAAGLGGGLAAGFAGGFARGCLLRGTRVGVAIFLIGEATGLLGVFFGAEAGAGGSVVGNIGNGDVGETISIVVVVVGVFVVVAVVDERARESDFVEGEAESDFVEGETESDFVEGEAVG